ncbi:MAG: hypothetical protein WB777_07455, partial [Mycobacterium sp.]
PAPDAPPPADAPPPPAPDAPPPADAPTPPAPDAPPPPAEDPAPPAPQAETVDMTGPADAPQGVHQANTVAHWTVVPQTPAPGDPALQMDPPSPQNLAPSYLKDVLNAIQSQSVSGNPALSSLA